MREGKIRGGGGNAKWFERNILKRSYPITRKEERIKSSGEERGPPERCQKEERGSFN